MSHGWTQPDWLPAAQRSRSLREAMLPYPIPLKRRPSVAHFTITRASVKSAIIVPKSGLTLLMLIVRFARHCGVSGHVFRHRSCAPLDEADPPDGC